MNTKNSVLLFKPKQQKPKENLVIKNTNKVFRFPSKVLLGTGQIMGYLLPNTPI